MGYVFQIMRGRSIGPIRGSLAALGRELYLLLVYPLLSRGGYAHYIVSIT
jgi:hypothetical protein